MVHIRSDTYQIFDIQSQNFHLRRIYKYDGYSRDTEIIKKNTRGQDNKTNNVNINHRSS